MNSKQNLNNYTEEMDTKKSTFTRSHPIKRKLKTELQTTSQSHPKESVPLRKKNVEEEQWLSDEIKVDIDIELMFELSIKEKEQ